MQDVIILRCILKSISTSIGSNYTSVADFPGRMGFLIGMLLEIKIARVFVDLWCGKRHWFMFESDLLMWTLWCLFFQYSTESPLSFGHMDTEERVWVSLQNHVFLTCMFFFQRTGISSSRSVLLESKVSHFANWDQLLWVRIAAMGDHGSPTLNVCNCCGHASPLLAVWWPAGCVKALRGDLRGVPRRHSVVSPKTHTARLVGKELLGKKPRQQDAIWKQHLKN